MNRESCRLALDLGTTTLAGRLLGAGGEVLAEGKLPNPQAALGGDVVRRMELALDGAGQRLQALLAGGVEALVGELLSRAGLPKASIAAAAAAGNPAVCHLLRNLPVEPLLFPPYRPNDPAGSFHDAAPWGLDLPVPLYLFPLVSGYVGGDLVAFVFSQGPCRPGNMFLDVGTNGEMALFTGERWLCTSVAAGPAFEGGEISCGMALENGAVTGVRVRGDVLELKVAGGVSPRGLCGSGLVEAVGAALEGGLIDRRGRIVQPDEVPTNLARYIAETPAGRVLRLYRDAATDLTLSQEDVRRFQLAKGAVRAGASCLLQKAGVEEGEIGRLVVTGAFGFSLGSEALKRVAMLPANMVDKVRFVPGGALSGVGRFLADPEGPAKVRTLASALRPYPLSGTPAFEKAFLKSLDF
ncbi:ASKHA domain-containing protein [uncultured Desulfuromonas sp.]|uniref:ASKHA domain-containing protein n=1 Tax=uncultured Desulfuromonas sp. TaxID=181013 RepID=UPI002601ECD6|nr:ASKHA domain-containing protein [uncultured Desulfuromonas sp.]